MIARARIGKINAFNEALLGSADSGNPMALKQLEVLQPAAAEISAQLVQSWDTITYSAVPAVTRLAGTMACMPSIVATASKSPHNRKIATEVSEGLQDVSRSVLASANLSEEQLAALAEGSGDESRTHDRIVTHMSHLGVLGVVWWGAAHGLRDERTRALPTDRASRRVRFQDGFMHTSNITVTDGKTDKEQPVHAKARASRPRGNCLYYPGIAAVAVCNLRDADGEPLVSPRALLEFLAADDTQHLIAVNAHIDERLERAQARLQRHTAASEQPLARAA